MTILKKRDKENQKFNPNLKYVKNREIISCFKHFKERLDERIGGDLAYETYWDTWIVYLRGKFVVENDGMMFRMIGNYHNVSDGEKMYKVIYKKINSLNIYVPLTIFELDKHNSRYRYFMKSINKNYRNKKL